MRRMNTVGAGRRLRALGLGLGVLGLAVWGTLACSSTPPNRADLMMESLDRLDDAIRAEVSDTARAEEVLALVDTFRGAENEFLEMVRVKKEWLTKLNRRYDADRVDFELEVRELREGREAFSDDILDFYLGLRELLSEEEYLVLIGELRADEARWAEMEG